MKKLIFLLTTLVLSTVLMGFSSHPVKQEESYKQSLTYSNLTDFQSQKEVRKAMRTAGITSKSTRIFLHNAISFNKTIEKKGLTKKGFVTISGLHPEYDPYAMQDVWEAKNPNFIGYNCRITTFDLMKNMISIGHVDTKNADWMTFDQLALENSPHKVFNKEEQKRFETLFSSIPTQETKDISVHVKCPRRLAKEEAYVF